MKTIFEPTDFDNKNSTLLGCVVRRVTVDEHEREYRNDSWVLGYITVVTADKVAAKKRYVRVSLEDGMVVGPMTVETMCEELNGGGYSLITKNVNLDKELRERRS
jgi:hypothetical protein